MHIDKTSIFTFFLFDELERCRQYVDFRHFYELMHHANFLDFCNFDELVLVDKISIEQSSILIYHIPFQCYNLTYMLKSFSEQLDQHNLYTVGWWVEVGLRSK